MVTDAPDEAAQQAADERERDIREEDELLGERARQNWEGVSSWTLVAAASEGGKTRDQAPVAAGLFLILIQIHQQATLLLHQCPAR